MEEYINLVNEITSQLKELYDTGYKKGYSSGYIDASKEKTEESYNKGLVDAWEYARKIIVGDMDDAFNDGSYYYIFKSNNVFEAINRIKEYEKEQKENNENQDISLGDEVMNDLGKWIVIYIDDFRKTVKGIDSKGHLHSDAIDNVKKTGDNFLKKSLNEILKK